jgi:hypothetical protein
MNVSTRLLIAFALVTWGIVAAGCSTPPQVNPWVDDAIPDTEWSTPSRDGVLAAHHDKVLRVRPDATEKQGPYVSGDVPHYPLYWEDPFTDKGDGDEYFAWTYADYIAMPYVFGRYIVNTIGAPISMVVHPPGTSMVSDGMVGKDHDTRVGTSPNPTAGPEDFGFEEPVSPGPPEMQEEQPPAETQESSAAS